MTTLSEVFAELGISHYLNDFVEQGFDTWETILDIKESDFDVLNVKLGHRRKIQRRIANSRGLSADRALGSSTQTPHDDRLADDQKGGTAKPDSKEAGAGGLNPGAKRKYRRHPKADENAPERPPSAYVIFSNKMREDLKGRNLSFTEIAKLVGENWQNLQPHDKEPYEKHASGAKEKYAAQMADYKKTEDYREYSQYLTDFKTRQSTQQSVNDLEPVKRPKLEAYPSTGSAGTTSSGTDTPQSSRGDSSHGQWSGTDHIPIPQPSASSKSNVGPGSGQHGPEVSQFTSSAILPGFRESIYGTNHPSLPWRDGSRDDGAAALQQFSQANVSHRRSSHSGTTFAESKNLTGPLQQQTPQYPPPLLTSDSTNSAVSTSTYFSPPTPIESQSERSMPLPSIFPQKNNENYDNQLAPLRPPSLSPQISLQSPNGIHPSMEFSPLHGYRNHAPPLTSLPEHHRQHEYMSSHPNDDNLDPVSALLKAGEIVNRNSRYQ